MKEKDEKRIDFKLWDLVKSSTKKIKSNDCVSHFPKKPFLKKEVSKPFQTTSKKEKITKISLKEWEKVLRVNINGTFIVTKSVLPGMISNGSGIIINIASQLGSVATRNSSHYCT